MTDALHVDARGEKCPMPVVLLARAARGADPASAITVHSDDPAAAHDIPAWCRMRGATLLETVGPDQTGAWTYRIRLAGEEIGGA
jgi:tRNA 2-thiouridine synthesizing protein A